MWFEEGNAHQAVPVVFPPRRQSPEAATLLDAWVSGQASRGPQSGPMLSPESEPRVALPVPTQKAPAEKTPSVAPPARSADDAIPAELLRIQQEIIDNLSHAIRDVHVLRTSLHSELEAQLVLLAAKMAQRVIQREVTVDPSIIAQLAREGIQALGDRQNVVIRLGPLPDSARTQAIVQQLRDEYPEIRVLIDAERGPGTCVVEAEFGRVDESLEARLDNVLCDILGAQIPVLG